MGDEKAADADIHAERADIAGNAKIAGGAVDIAIDFDEVDLAVDLAVDGAEDVHQANGIETGKAAGEEVDGDQA